MSPHPRHPIEPLLRRRRPRGVPVAESPPAAAAAVVGTPQLIAIGLEQRVAVHVHAVDHRAGGGQRVFLVGGQVADGSRWALVRSVSDFRCGGVDGESAGRDGRRLRLTDLGGLRVGPRPGLAVAPWRRRQRGARRQLWCWGTRVGPTG